MWRKCPVPGASFLIEVCAGESPAATPAFYHTILPPPDASATRIFLPRPYSVFRPGKEDRSWRLDRIDGREAALVDGQTYIAAGIDVEQRLAQRHVAECGYERDVHLGLADSDVHSLPMRIAQLEKIIAADVGHQV